jgi:hypothetical protein
MTDPAAVLQALQSVLTPDPGNVRSGIESHVNHAFNGRQWLAGLASKHLAAHPDATSGFADWPLDEPIASAPPQPGFCACPALTVTLSTVGEYVTATSRLARAALEMALACPCPRPPAPGDTRA